MRSMSAMLIALFMVTPAFAQSQPSPEYQTGIIETLQQQLSVAISQSAKYAEQLQFTRKELAALKASKEKPAEKPAE